MNSRWERWLSWLCFGIAACLLGWASYFWFTPEPRLTVEAPETDFEITNCPVGQKRDVVLRLDNRSSHPLRVLGVTEC